jgi:septal ring factor EnvC (AmiA/AmiB activator)
MWRRLADFLLGWLCLSHTAFAFLDPNPAASSSTSGNHMDILLDQMTHRMTLMEDSLRTKDGQITTLQTDMNAKIASLQTDMNNKDSQISSLQTNMNTKDSQIASLQQTISSVQNTQATQGKNILKAVLSRFG